MSNVHLKGVLAVIAAAVLWGSTGTLQSLLPDNSLPMVVAATRLLIGALTLLLLAFADRDSRLAFGTLPWLWVIGAGVSIALYNLMFFLAVSLAGVGIGTALAIGSAPVWALLWEWLRYRRLPSVRVRLGQGACIAGACALALAGSGHADISAAGLGTLLALSAGLGYASYSLFSSHIVGRVPSHTLAASTFSVAALVLLPVLFIYPTRWVLQPAAMSGVLVLGVIATGMAYALYTWGLRYTTASTAITLALAEPLTAWLLATTVVGEPLSALKLLGGTLLLVGLALVSRG